MMCGEANHHRRADRGWSYFMIYVDSDGVAWRIDRPTSTKTALKALGLAPELLAGSGDCAAMVRILHALRAGIIKPSAIGVEH